MSGTTQQGAMHLEGLEQAYKAGLSKLEGAGGTESLGDVVEQFKTLWPQVKQGLELLRQLSGLVPGVGSIVSVVIGIILAAGDAAAKAS